MEFDIYPSNGLKFPVSCPWEMLENCKTHGKIFDVITSTVQNEK